MMIVTSLPEEFVLLAYGDDGAAQLDSSTLGYGLGGALLLELALAERVDVVDKKVVVADPAPHEDPLIDAALQQVRDDPKPRGPQHWVDKLSRGARDAVLERLVANGTLTREQDKVLWVFPRTRFLSAYGVEPPVETATRQRLHAAVAGTGAVEARTAAMCALVAATGLDKKVFHELPRAQVTARLKEIGEGAWAATAVKKAIEEIQAAMMVSVMVATTAATAGGSS
jgi:hypothetical protein